MYRIALRSETPRTACTCSTTWRRSRAVTIRSKGPSLRKAIEKVFGQRHPIQRCRNHKLRNVLGHLPKDQHPQVKAAFRAAMKLDAKQGEQKLRAARGAGEGGEVEVPAYAAMRRPGAVADRMLEVLMPGVSTRKYGRQIGEMFDTIGVSKSAVSRETVEASERVLKELMERRLDASDLLVIYLDGIQMGSHHVLAAVGVVVSRYLCKRGVRGGWTNWKERGSSL